jgi:hypothetical protein
MENMFKSKKAATFQSFWEVMLISVVFVVAIGIIGTNMNSLYGQNHDLTFGIASNSTLSQLESTSNALEAAQSGGQSSTTSLGLFTLTTIPTMMASIFSITKDFILGGWIARLVYLMNLGDYSSIIIIALQLLYFAILIFILIKLIIRVTV